MNRKIRNCGILLLLCYIVCFDIRLCNAFGVEGDDGIPPSDPNFSDNACIVVKPYEIPDCELAPPPFNPGEEIPPDPCPGCPDDDDGDTPGEVSPEGTQIFYDTIEDALEFCPFDPVFIELVGTIYMTDAVSTIGLYYNQSKDLILSGVVQNVTTPDSTVVVLVEEEVIVFNETTMMNETQIILVEQNVTIEGSTEFLSPIVVGMRDLQVLFDNISITIQDVTFEGCDTDRPFFLTLVKDDRCDVPDPGDVCKGEYFREEDIGRIINDGSCTRTGALFDGYRGYEGLGTPEGIEAWQSPNELTMELWFNPSRLMMQDDAWLVGNIHEDDDSSNVGAGFIWKHDITADPFQTEEETFGVDWLVGIDGKFGEDDDNTAFLQVELRAGNWVHLAGVFDNGFQELYVNGRPYANITRSGDTIDYGIPIPLRIAWGIDSSDDDDNEDVFMEGIIDELRVWRVARTSAQILATYQDVVDPSDPDLLGYFRYDYPRDGETDNYVDNLAAIAQSDPDRVMNFVLREDPDPPDGYEGPPVPIPVCFCDDPPDSGLCTVRRSQAPDAPHEAITDANEEGCNQDDQTCIFLHGMLINPNGALGKLWLPGVCSSSGPPHNETVRFIPGVFEECPITELVEIPDPMDPNNTIIVEQQVGNGTEPCFVPGTAPQQLPPIDIGNPFGTFECFTPGWFLNGGFPPFWALNFVPGIFVPVGDAPPNAIIPEDDSFDPETDYIFVPGIRDCNGTFTPFDPDDPYYMFIEEEGGVAFNPEEDVDRCFLPPQPIGVGDVGEEEQPTVIETEFGCEVEPEDEEPEVIVGQRDPCFVLRQIRDTLPPGTEMMEPEDVIGCDIGPDDPEPLVLDPSQRDPCFVLRELRERLAVENATGLVCPEGTVFLPRIYMPCLRNQNLTLLRTVYTNYIGPKVVCQHACDIYVTLVVDTSRFVNTPGSALFSSGLHHYDVRDSNFCPCGGQTEECVYLNGHHGPRDDREFSFFNNRHCAIQDLLPIQCEYDISPELRCINGVLQCLDIATTLLEDCQQVEVMEDMLLFDSDCAVFAPCQCGATTQNITYDNGLFNVTEEVEVFTEDIVIQIQFLTPLLEELTGGSDIFVIPCGVEEVLTDVNTICFEFVNFTFPIFPNDTITLELPIPFNCTIQVPVMSGMPDGSLPCPCPDGFNGTNAAVNGTGSAVNSLLDIYSNCAWQLPEDAGFVEGEVCIDGIVQCPIEGGQIGEGGAPPAVPVGLCDGSQATVVCDDTTCIANELIYEGMIHFCDLNVGTCASDGLLTVPCMCSDGALTLPCQRGTGAGFCERPVPCNMSMPQCAITMGEFVFDGSTYLCMVPAGEDDCIGISHVGSEPDPPDGQITLPCDNHYETPGPGPCSCIPNQAVGNSSIPGSPPPGCAANDTDCYNNADTPIPTNDPALQLTCTPDGFVRCRCDGFYALNNLFEVNGTSTLNPEACAYRIDHVPDHAGLFFMQNNVAQQLPYGMCLERLTYDMISRFPLKVFHFFEETGTMHELARVNTLVTATISDWVDGHFQQWNQRFCHAGCPQARPRQITEACVVDSTYGEHVDDFNVLRYNDIQVAIDDCPFPSVIVHKAENPYELQMFMGRENFWIGSYDNAVIVGSNHRAARNNFTMRGLTVVHTGTEQDPLIVTGDGGDDGDNDFETGNFTLLNNRFFGNGVNDAGVLVGTLTDFLVFSYNFVSGFYTRSVQVDTPSLIAVMNRWEDTTGRAFRGRSLDRFRFDENEFIEVVGINTADDVAIVSLEVSGDIPGIVPLPNPGFFFFGDDDDTQLFGEPEISPAVGCNPSFEEQNVCYFRGNRQVVQTEQEDFSTVVYNFLGGNMTTDNFHHNQATHGFIGAKFTFTLGISYDDREILYQTNALLRVEDTHGGVNTGQFGQFGLAGGGGNSNDLAFQAPGSLQVQGCSFPGCQMPDNPFPPMEVNPRCGYHEVDFYGYECVNNVTWANRYGMPENLVNITSGRARLRVENKFLLLNMWAVGYEDLFCCDKPVFYGADHTIASFVTALEFIEYRFLYNQFEDADGATLFRTQTEFDALTIHFREICFDGQYTIGLHKTRIADLYMRDFDGDFLMEDCRVYNWWHYPFGTKRAFIDDPEGARPVVMLPDGTVYYIESSPEIDGFFIHFRPFRQDQTPFVLRPPAPQPVPFVLTPEQYQEIRDSQGGTTNDGDNLLLRPALPTINPYIERPMDIFDVPESKCTIMFNHFENLDGRALSVHEPANAIIVDNNFTNCGMRQYEEICTVEIQGNERSMGEYFIECNCVNQTLPYLFPFGGGQGSRIWHAAFMVHGFSRLVVEWTFKNNKVGVNFLPEGVMSITGGTGEEITGNSDYVSTPREDLETEDGPGPSIGGFPNFLGLGDKSTSDLEPFDGTKEDVVGTPLEPHPGLGGTNGLIDAEQGILTLRDFPLPTDVTGHTIALLIYRVPDEIIALTLTPGVTNTTLFPFFQPSLFPLRILAYEGNAIPATEWIADGLFTKDNLPRNHPDYMNGIKHDLVQCDGYEEIFQDNFRPCAICNDGCPVCPTDRCVVDPGNDTFVPENPFFNKWLFHTIDDAVLHCRDPKRNIEVRKQSSPYTHIVDIQVGNWTIFTNDGAEILLQTQSFLINANDLKLVGFTLIHDLGGTLPTLKTGTALGGSAMHILIEKFTFLGQGTGSRAIDGDFDTIQIIECDFLEYTGPRVVELITDCGSGIVVEQSHWENVPGNALFISEYEVIDIMDNKFDGCGGQVANEMSCVYVRSCIDSLQEFIFAGNEHWRDEDDVVFEMTGPDNGYVAAYWLDGLPLLDDTIHFDFTDNAAHGLPIGMRVSRADNLHNAGFGYYSLDVRATVQYIYLGFRQLRLSGTWHFVVRGDPSNDAAIDMDPPGTEEFYCDEDCSGSAQSTTLIATLAIVAVILFLFIVIPLYCILPMARYRTVFVRPLGEYWPASWRQAFAFGQHSARELSRNNKLWKADTRPKQLERIRKYREKLRREE